MPRLKDSIAALRDAPDAARVLGLAGLIPFLAPAFTLWVVDGPFGESLAQALCLYGAVILSFLGGVRWGALLRAAPTGWWPWIASIAPSLVGWAAVLVGGAVGLIALAVGFAVQWRYDLNAVRSGELPAWFGGLRTVLTAGAVASVLLGALAIV